MTADLDRSPWPQHDPWTMPTPDDPRGGTEYAALIEAFRLLQNRLAGATPPDHVAAELSGEVQDLARRLGEYQVPETERWDGRRPDLPGRGHPLLPPVVIDETFENGIRGRVTFGRVYLGGNGAAHGGCLPLLFDDLLGRVTNMGRDTVARTAYLTTNYRHITPIEVELTVEATLDKVDGRKRWASGRVSLPAGPVVCDAEALFVELKPGQP